MANILCILTLVIAALVIIQDQDPSPVSPVETPISCIATVPAVRTIVKEL